MREIDPGNYGPEVAEFLKCPAPDGLVHGRPVVAMEESLAALTLPTLCQVALWLRFDFGARGHAVVQGLSGTDACYWHAIHHRREPDPDNARYWFRRTGSHRIHPELLRSAIELGNGSMAARKVSAWPIWDALGFVDLCTLHAGKESADEAFCQLVQQREWALLFDHGFQAMPG